MTDQGKIRRKKRYARRQRTVNRAYRTGGSDGLHTRTLEFSRRPRFRPLRRAHPDKRPRPSRTADARISVGDWPTIIARAECEGLRPIAADYGVSQETIRAVLLRAGRANVLTDVERRRALETAAPLPPPAPMKVPKERYGEVAQLCQRHTQAEVAALLGVSQATVWRIVRRSGGREGLEAAGMGGA